MLSTGVTFRDTHGSLFQDLSAEWLSCLSHKNRLSQIDVNFAANMFCAAFSCPLPTEKGCPLLVLDTAFFITSHSREISSGLQNKHNLS
jgi:hypothetical protein